MAKKSAKRTDLHKPSVIVPTDYTLIACDYQGVDSDEMMAFREERLAFRKWRERVGAKFAEVTRSDGSDGSRGCDVCGAAIAYMARFHHVPTNTVVTTGMDCAAKMEIGDAEAFASFRKKVQGELRTRTGKLKAQRILGERNLMGAWAIFATPDYTTLPRNPKRYCEDEIAYEELTILNIVGKVVKYGDISDAQAGFVGALLDRISKRATIAAERAAATAHVPPVPVTDERIEVVGEIVSTKTVTSDYGDVEKCLIRTTAGWKVWGTCVIGGKGDTVAFMARVTRSDKDDKFGFYSRPTKPRIVKAGPETQAELDKAAPVQAQESLNGGTPQHIVEAQQAAAEVWVGRNG